MARIDSADGVCLATEMASYLNFAILLVLIFNVEIY